MFGGREGGDLGFWPLGEEAGAGSGAEEEERRHDERPGRCLVNAFSFWANQHYWTVGWMGLDSIDSTHHTPQCQCES